jgi:predicted metal-dependent hydrolase
MKPARIQPRRPANEFADVPKYWFGGNKWATHMANSLNLLFPLGERFFVRSVSAFVDRLTDPKLRDQVRGFIAQEARHGLEHESFFEQMEAHGSEIRSFLDLYERLAWQTLEPTLSPELRLAVTVSLEHFTATFAHYAFTRPTLDRVHPAMKKLLLWHAAEEIEHKSVAFDVLKAVDPSYRTRVLGHVVATVGLLGFWWAGAYHLMRQDRAVTWKELLSGRSQSRGRGALSLGDIARSFVSYLAPDYHPWQTDDYHLAQQLFADQGFAAAG